MYQIADIANQKKKGLHILGNRKSIHLAQKNLKIVVNGGGDS